MEDPKTLKDAYDKWLEDVSTMTRKRKTKKRSKRIAALRQLQRPTESSTNKSTGPTGLTKAKSIDTLPLVVDRDTAFARQQEAQRRRFQIQADEANYTHYQWDASVEPGLAFFAMLARQMKGKSHHKTTGQRAVISRAEAPGFPVRVLPTVLKPSGETEIVLVFTIEQEVVEPQEEAEVGKPRKWNHDSVSQGTTMSEWTLQAHYFCSRELYESRLPWIQQLLMSHLDQDGSSSSPIAVFKTSSSSLSPVSTSIELLDSPTRVEEVLRSLWEQGAEHQTVSSHQAVQAFIPSTSCTSNNSSSKAWIARPAYRKKDQGASVVWILTGNDSAMASTVWQPETPLQPCQIVKCVNTQSWREPRMIVESLSQWLELQVFRPTNLGTVGDLVIDLVQDLRGQWWLLQIKAVQVRKSYVTLPSVKDCSSRARSAPDRLGTISVLSSSTKRHQATKAKWKCSGKYCDQSMDRSELHETGNEPSGYLTKKELLSCEFYDKYHGSSDASVLNGCTKWSDALAFYLQHQLHRRDRTTLYEPQPLCTMCLHVYHKLRLRYLEQVALEQDIDAPPGNKQIRKKKVITVSKSLPALIGTTAKQSAPSAISTPSQSIAPPAHSAKTAETAVPSYMEELERIKQLLTDNRTPARVQQPDESSTTPKHASTIAQDGLKSLLSWAQFSVAQNDRVEEMWQSVQLKPLQKASKSESTNSLSTVESKKAGYNLTRAEVPKEPHFVSLLDCHRVFSDDLYRDSLVAETKHRLLTLQQPVRFVVLSYDGVDDPDDASLARMALRSIGLDILQALEQDGVSLPHGLPPVDEDAVGGVSMTVSM